MNRVQLTIFIGVTALGLGMIDGIARKTTSFADASLFGKGCAVVVAAAVLSPVFLRIWNLIKGKRK